jgi:hypothetical protein
MGNHSGSFGTIIPPLLFNAGFILQELVLEKHFGIEFRISTDGLFSNEKSNSVNGLELFILANNYERKF